MILPPRITHEARYQLAPEEIPGLLGIKVPPGAAVVLEHVSVGGRVTAFAEGAKLVIRVTWADPLDAAQALPPARPATIRERPEEPRNVAGT